MSVLIKVSAIWPLLKREVHQENLINYGKTTGRYVTISNSQSARRALWASSPQPIWAVAAGNRILRQRCWHKKSRKCISLQDHVNLYQDIKVLTSYCSIIGKPISGQDRLTACARKGQNSQFMLKLYCQDRQQRSHTMSIRQKKAVHFWTAFRAPPGRAVRYLTYW